MISRSHASRAGRTALLAALLLPVAVTESGCAGHHVPPKTAASARVQPIEVTDRSFARDTAALFLAKESPVARNNRLAGVVRYQLGRAAQLYEAGHDAAGLSAVEGALYLIRAGEFDPSMAEGRSSALFSAANAVSRAGSEGRALALYSILNTITLGPAERQEVQSHLDAIKRWTESTRSKGPLQSAGTDQRTATLRALWEPRPDTLRTARAALLQWMERAISFSKEQLPPTDELERDEAMEAYQAIRTGPFILSALYLRNGNPGGALEAMESPNVARLVSPHLHEALRRASEDDDPAAWLELFSTFERSSAAVSDLGVDPEVAQAAAWGAAVELCRIEPHALRGVMPLATLLMRHGMGEVGPLLLAPVVQRAGRAEIASLALGYVLEALASADRVGDLEAARRTFENASPLFTFIEKQSIAKDVTPSVSRVRLAMGALEARAGELSVARPLVVGAASREPTLPALELLAAIDRQQGSSASALTALSAVRKLATDASDPTTIADAYLNEFEILRDAGRADEARAAIEQALRRALDARKLARTGAEHASAERVLARILEQYGDLEGANRASERAYDAARNDLGQVTATVLDAARRGLVRGQLRAARSAARHALEANMAGDDLVYVALWLRLLERRATVPSDGTVEEAFAKIDDSEGWAGKLRAWCLGRLTDEQLFGAARSRSQRTEASFYAAMAAYAANARDALQRLSPIAHGEAIELVEVTIARDLIAGQKSLDLKIPKDVQVP